MYAKKIFIFLIIIGFPFAAFADTEAYYTNVGPNTTVVSRPHHHNKSGFTVSLNIPTVATTSYTVSHPHAHQPYWLPMRAGDPVPANAVIGGSQPYPSATLYVCQGSYRGGVHPGKLFNGNCNIGWGGKEIVLNQYQVLAGRNGLRWVPGADGYVPKNAVQGGYQQDGPLYICRAAYRGGLHPGKIVGANCNIGWGGAEITIPEYEVLAG